MSIDIVRNFPFFSIFLMMFTGIMTSPVRKGKVAFVMSLISSSVVFAMSLTLLIRLASNSESYAFMMGHFPAPWGNEIKAGPLEALMAVLFSGVTILSMLGGLGDIFHDILPEKQNLYFIALNFLLGAMLALIYTNDMFTAYVFIEISTISASCLIMAKDSSRSLVAAMRYLIMMLLGSGLFLLGIIILYVITGELLMADVHTQFARLFVTRAYMGPLRVTVGLIVIGIAIKSALFPFHTMLPGAHSVATPTSSAILSGLVLKSFIFLLIKLVFRVFSVGMLQSLGILDVLFVLSILAMIVCSILALREDDLKRMIAYSSTAQMGYIFLGISLAATGGGTVACYHILAHALTKTMLFICAGGLIDASGHTTSLHELRGAGRRNRMAGLGFTLGGLSMIGVPILPGFVSKLYLALAAAGDPWRLGITLTALIVSMLLNALYFVPVMIAIWSKDDRPTDFEAPRTFKVTIGVYLVLNVLLGLFFQPVMQLIEQGIELL